MSELTRMRTSSMARKFCGSAMAGTGSSFPIRSGTTLCRFAMVFWEDAGHSGGDLDPARVCKVGARQQFQGVRELLLREDLLLCEYRARTFAGTSPEIQCVRKLVRSDSVHTDVSRLPGRKEAISRSSGIIRAGPVTQFFAPLPPGAPGGRSSSGPLRDRLPAGTLPESGDPPCHDGMQTSGNHLKEVPRSSDTDGRRTLASGGI